MGQNQSKGTKLKSKEIKNLVNTTHFDSTEVKSLYDHFTRISGSLERDNLIDYNEFLKAIGTKDSDFAKRLFGIFDEDGNGTISFEEFVNGMSILCTKGSLQEKLEFTFNIYDVNGDNTIDKDELANMLRASLMDSFHLTDKQIKELVDATFKDVDVNGDGHISFEEYSAMVKKHPQIIKSMSINLGSLSAPEKT